MYRNRQHRTQLGRIMTAQLAAPPKNHLQSGPKYIPIETLIELHSHNLSNVQIAKIVGCSTQAVQKRLSKCSEILSNTQNYKKHRADVLTFKQQKLSSMIAASDVTIGNSRDLKDVSIAYRNFYECERLERGQSTANIAYQDVSQRAKQRDNEIEALRQELGIDNSIDLSST